MHLESTFCPRLEEADLKTWDLERPINGGVDHFQPLSNLVKTIVVSIMEWWKVVEVLLVERTRHFFTHAVPVEAAITTTRAICVANTIMEC